MLILPSLKILDGVQTSNIEDASTVSTILHKENNIANITNITESNLTNSP